MELKHPLPRNITCPSLAMAYSVASLVVTLSEKTIKRDPSLRAESLFLLKDGPTVLNVSNSLVILDTSKPRGVQIRTITDALSILTHNPLMIGEYEVTTDQEGIHLDGLDFVEWELARKLAALDPNSRPRPAKKSKPIQVFDYQAVPRSDGLVIGCQFIPWEEVRKVMALDPSKKKPAPKSAKKTSKKRPARSVKKKK